jgi:hypothetical protein
VAERANAVSGTVQTGTGATQEKPASTQEKPASSQAKPAAPQPTSTGLPTTGDFQLTPTGIKPDPTWPTKEGLTPTKVTPPSLPTDENAFTPETHKGDLM